MDDESLIHVDILDTREGVAQSLSTLQALSPTTTCRELCDAMENKMDLSSEEAQHYRLILIISLEMKPSSSSGSASTYSHYVRTLQADDCVAQVQQTSLLSLCRKHNIVRYREHSQYSQVSSNMQITSPFASSSSSSSSGGDNRGRVPQSSGDDRDESGVAAATNDSTTPRIGHYGSTGLNSAKSPEIVDDRGADERRLANSGSSGDLTDEAEGSLASVSEDGLSCTNRSTLDAEDLTALEAAERDRGTSTAHMSANANLSSLSLSLSGDSGDGAQMPPRGSAPMIDVSESGIGSESCDSAGSVGMGFETVADSPKGSDSSSSSPPPELAASTITYKQQRSYTGTGTSPYPAPSPRGTSAPRHGSANSWQGGAGASLPIPPGMRVRWVYKSYHTHPLDIEPGDQSGTDSDTEDTEVSLSDLAYLRHGAEKRGFLLKQSSTDPNIWRRRYCLLTDKLWCLNAKTLVPIGSALPITGRTRLSSTALPVDFPFVFLVDLTGTGKWACSSAKASRSSAADVDLGESNYNDNAGSDDGDGSDGSTSSSSASNFLVASSSSSSSSKGAAPTQWVLRATSYQDQQEWLACLHQRQSQARDNDVLRVAEAMICDDERRKQDRLNRSSLQMLNTLGGRYTLRTLAVHYRPSSSSSLSHYHGVTPEKGRSGTNSGSSTGSMTNSGSSSSSGSSHGKSNSSTSGSSGASSSPKKARKASLSSLSTAPTPLTPGADVGTRARRPSNSSTASTGSSSSIKTGASSTSTSGSTSSAGRIDRTPTGSTTPSGTSGGSSSSRSHPPAVIPLPLRRSHRAPLTLHRHLQLQDPALFLAVSLANDVAKYRELFRMEVQQAGAAAGQWRMVAYVLDRYFDVDASVAGDACVAPSDGPGPGPGPAGMQLTLTLTEASPLCRPPQQRWVVGPALLAALGAGVFGVVRLKSRAELECQALYFDLTSRGKYRLHAGPGAGSSASASSRTGHPLSPSDAASPHRTGDPTAITANSATSSSGGGSNSSSSSSSSNSSNSNSAAAASAPAQDRGPLGLGLVGAMRGVQRGIQQSARNNKTPATSSLDRLGRGFWPFGWLGGMGAGSAPAEGAERVPEEGLAGTRYEFLDCYRSAALSSNGAGAQSDRQSGTEPPRPSPTLFDAILVEVLRGLEVDAVIRGSLERVGVTTPVERGSGVAINVVSVSADAVASASAGSESPVKNSSSSRPPSERGSESSLHSTSHDREPGPASVLYHRESLFDKE